MALRRSSLLLLSALLALLAVPASALALPPQNTTLSPPAGGWVKSGYTVTPTGNDADGDPIDLVEWDLDDGNGPQTGPPGSVVTIPAGPVVELTTRVQAGGEWSLPRTYTYNVDDAAPLDLTSIDPVWQSGPVDVPLDASPDGGSPIAKFQYRFGNDLFPIDTVGLGPWTAHAGPDGEYTLYTRAFDLLGNTSVWKPNTVKIDSQAPLDETQVAAGWSTTSPVTVTVEGSDVTSGVQTVRWRKGTSGAFTEVAGTSTPVTFSTDGDHALDTQLVDKAGHVSTVKSQRVKIDTVDPVNTSPAMPAGTVDSPRLVTLNGTDAGGSGVARVEWRIDGGTVGSVAPSTQVSITGHGTRTVETRVVDNAGRTSAWRPETITLDAKTNDSTAPDVTTTTASTSWYLSATDVTVEADDGFGSGVREVQWHVENQTNPESSPIQSALGATKTFPLPGEGEYIVRTRAIDIENNASAWQEQTFKVDLHEPVDATAVPTGWQKSRTFTLSATDPVSGIDRIEYSINGGPYQNGTQGQNVNVGADGEFSIRTRVFDVAGQRSAPKLATLMVDTALPAVTSAAAPGGWLNAPLSHALAGTDALSGLDKMQWRIGATGEIHDGGPAVIDADGVHTLQTRAVDRAGNESLWRSETVSVDTTKPTNTTVAAPTEWRKTAYTAEITGDDGAGSGVDHVEWELDGGLAQTGPSGSDVPITADGVHTLRSRIVDEVAHASDWREETIKIDSAAPQAALSCSSGADVWSRVPVTCSVTADGGLSGLGSATLAGADGGTAAVANGAVATVSSDGGHTLQLDAVDGAGNAAAADATVYVDRTAPAAGLSCASADGKYSCRADASDGTSGLAVLGWSLDGGAFETIASGGSFTVAKGQVRLRAVDAAGNETITEPVTLAAIPVTAKVRISNVPVYLAGKNDTQSMLGALYAVRSSTGTVSLDLRPLAVGRGTYRVEIALKSGKHSKKVKRNYKVGRTGALPRISASLSKAVEKTTITLTVSKKVGKRWRKHAGTRLVLAK